MEKSIVIIIVKRYEDLEYHYCNCEGTIKEIEVRKEGACNLTAKFKLVTETILKNIC